TAHHKLVDLETPFAEPAYGIELRFRDRLAGLTPGVGEELQRPRAGHLGILLAEAARGRIARVGKGLSALGHAPVECHEVVAPHVDLATNLDQVGGAGRQPLRHLVEGAYIGCDVLARRAVTTGCG